MKIAFVLAVFPMFAAADTITGGQCGGVVPPPTTQTLDGVSFVECSEVNNFSEVIAVDFGANVSAYSLNVTFTNPPSSASTGDIRVTPSWGSVVASTNCVQLFGTCISRSFNYAVAGTWPGGVTTGTRLFNLSIDLLPGLTWGAVGGLPNVKFSSLTDPPEAPVATPEPATAVLTVLPLFVVFLAKRYFLKHQTRLA